MMPKTSLSAALLVPFWAIPIGAFLWMVQQCAIDVPYWDDYLSILWSLGPIAKKQSLPEMVQAVFSQHNEHRLALLRAVSLADWWLFGLVNFRHLAIAGNLFLFGIVLLLMRASNLSFNLLLFAPLVPLMFQLHFYDASLWSTAALSHFPVLFLAFASLLLLVRPPRWCFELACLLAVLAAYTQGNGLLVFVIGSIGLILLKRYLRVAAWIGLWGLVVILYFRQFEFSYSATAPSAVAAWAHPLKTLQFLFLFIGAVGIPGESAIPSAAWLLASSLIAGVLLFAALGYLLYRRAHQKNLRLCLLALFLLASSATVGLVRVGMGMEYALSSRYAVYSAILVAVIYLLLLEVSAGRQRVTAWCGLAVTASLWLANFLVYLPMVQAREVQLRQSARLGNGCYEKLIYRPGEIAESILHQAEKLQLYFLPLSRTPSRELCRSVEFYETALEQSLPPITRVGGAVDTLRLQGNALRITGWVPIRQTETEQRLHVALPREPVWREVTIFDRPDVAQKLGDPEYLRTGFLLRLHYLTPEAAAQAVPGLCLAAGSIRTPVTLLSSGNPNCRRFLR